MAYQKKFTKPFPGGYRDFPDESTIITASVMDNYDQTLEDFDAEFENVDGKLEKLKGVDNLKSAFKFDESGNPVGVEVVGDVIAKGCGGESPVSLVEVSKVASEAIPGSAKGVANGVAQLDETGKVPVEQLPDIPTGVSSWSDIENKPFESIGSGLNVVDGVLNVINGGSSSGSNLIVDTLWDEVISSTGTYTLAKSIDEYDFLIATAWSYTSSIGYQQYCSTVIPKNDYYVRSTLAGEEDLSISVGIGADRKSVFQFDDDVTLRIANQNTAKFKSLYGVKLSGGGGNQGSKSYTSITMQVTALNGSNTIMLSEIKLYKDGVEINYPEGTTCTASLSPSTSSEGAENLIDGNLATKYNASFNNSCAITIRFPEPIEFDSYSYVTAHDANQWHGRNPDTWQLFGEKDNNYELLSTVFGANVPNESNIETPLYKLNISTSGGSSESEIYQGAVDAGYIGTPYEFGQQLYALLASGSGKKSIVTAIASKAKSYAIPTSASAVKIEE